MKVFVVTSHLEYEDSLPETCVEGVFSTREKAIAVRDSVYGKFLDTNLENGWKDVAEEDLIYTENANSRDVLNTSNDDYIRVEVWEREVE